MEPTTAPLPGSVGEDEDPSPADATWPQTLADTTLVSTRRVLPAPAATQASPSPAIDAGGSPVQLSREVRNGHAPRKLQKKSSVSILQARKDSQEAKAREESEKQLAAAREASEAAERKSAEKQLEQPPGSHAASTQLAGHDDGHFHHQHHHHVRHHHEGFHVIHHHDSSSRHSLTFQASFQVLKVHDAKRLELKQAEDDAGWPNPHKYNSRSLYLFDLKHPVRRLAIAGIEYRFRGVNVWETTVLALILLNTLQLAMYDPFDIPALKPVSPFRDGMDVLAKFFSAVFLAECLVKVLALGFFVGRHTYLDDGFNYLDLFIVIIGMLDFFPSDGSTGNLSALRSLRVMRPLKLVTKFQELKSCVLILLSSIPDLSNAVGLLVFIIVLFAILGVQLFGGVYRKACYSHEDGTRRDSPSPCGYIPCPDSFECLQLGENPGRGVISFDDIGPAIMTVTRLAIPPKSYYHTKLPFLYYFTTESCGGKNACRFLDL
jgi:hypothetical protein